MGSSRSGTSVCFICKMVESIVFFHAQETASTHSNYLNVCVCCTNVSQILGMVREVEDPN